MKLAIYTNSISPHQLPLARELVASLGAGNVIYAYESAESKGRRSLGWKQEPEPWCRQASECGTDVETCDILLVGGIRPVSLMEKRSKAGLRTLYMSERWFKPPVGMLRLSHPKYFNMARRWVKLMRSEQSFTYLPIGIHAARDMARLCGLFAGDLRCLFRAPKLDFERKPGGNVLLASKTVKDAKKYCLDKMRMWGYFVEAGNGERGTGNREQGTGVLRVLWVGRLLGWKRVDTIIRAVGELSARSTRSMDDEASAKDATRLKITLDIYGTGPEETRLKKFAAKYEDVIRFYPPVPIAEVRKVMREHDVYVLASNGYEGWGAVVSEALEEGMRVIGTYEAGSSSTMLSEKSLFHTGDWKMLSNIIQNVASRKGVNFGVGMWSAKEAANAIVNSL